jgi:hypothetical protein
MTSTVTFTGPPIDDEDILARVPSDLADRLRQTNGFIWNGGGLHVRGACHEPAWHSLRAAWEGDAAFHVLYPAVEPGDVPFAEDCLGDQFLIRDGSVWQLAAETGDIANLAVDLPTFFAAAEVDPLEFLGMHPLVQFQTADGALEPGELLSVMPPYCVKSDEGYDLRAIPTLDRRSFLAQLAAQIRDLPDGGTIEFKVTE